MGGLDSRLVVPYEHGRPCLQRLLPALPPSLLAAADLIDAERDARAQPHGPLERSSDSPLAETAIANGAEEDGRDDAVARAHDQHGERGDAEGDKAGLLAQTAGQHEGEGAQQHDDRDRGGGEVEEPAHAGLRGSSGIGAWCCVVRMRLAGCSGSGALVVLCASSLRPQQHNAAVESCRSNAWACRSNCER